MKMTSSLTQPPKIPPVKRRIMKAGRKKKCQKKNENNWKKKGQISVREYIRRIENSKNSELDQNAGGQNSELEQNAGGQNSKLDQNAGGHNSKLDQTAGGQRPDGRIMEGQGAEVVVGGTSKEVRHSDMRMKNGTKLSRTNGTRGPNPKFGRALGRIGPNNKIIRGLKEPGKIMDRNHPRTTSSTQMLT